MKTSELIYDWNRIHPASLRPSGRVLLNDETLRDGLQSPSVRDPSIQEKIHILHLMEALGINSLDRRNRPAHRVEHRRRNFYWFESDPPLHRRLDRRLLARDHGKGGEVRG